MRGDRGDIVLGWLTRLVAVVGALGILGFDGVALGQARFQAEDRASNAATAAAVEYASSHSAQKAYDAAYATLPVADGDTIETSTFTVAQDGTVKLRVHHTGTTLLLHKLGPTKHWAEAVATGEARAAT